MRRTINVLLGTACVVAIACGGSGEQSSESKGLAVTSDGGQSDAADAAETTDGGAQGQVTIVQNVQRSDIVSDLSGAKARDENLQNAWGLAFNPAGRAWVAANETGIAAVYDPNGKQLIPSITIPPPSGMKPPAHPSGQVMNPNAGAFMGDTAIFVTEDGTVSGWQAGQGSQPSTSATLRVDNSSADAVYKGVAMATSAMNGPQLYAANFAKGKVDVFDASYKAVDTSGKFVDDQIPDGFAPFNLQAVDGLLYVTYAKREVNGTDDVKGAGNGFVDVFDPDGTMVSRLIQHGSLNSPWGIAVAPQGFGSIANRLLVGNFGDGAIHAYKLTPTDGGSLQATEEGALGDKNGKELKIDGLWALQFGVDAGGFKSSSLYFTAGPNEEADGVFGELSVPTVQPTPPPEADAGVGDGGKTW
jgi:uncharacterized protein (TIGR03118 family)